MQRRFTGLLATLALALGVLVAGGVQAAQPAAAASWRNPNPSIAVNRNGNQWVFWQGTNGGLWEAYNNGKWHGPIAIRQMGRLGSVPSVALVNNDPYVVWEGTDGNVWLGYWNGSWRGPYKLGFGRLGSRPSMFTDQDNVLTVVWKGTNRALWYAVSPRNPTQRGWSGPHSLGDGPLGSAPTGTGCCGGQYLDAAWAGTGRADLWWHEGDGTLSNLGQGPLDSPPAVTSFPNPSDPESWEGFWAGTDGNLWSAIWDFDILGGISVLQPAFKLGMGPLVSAPAAAFDTNTFFVIWEGSDRNLWEATCYPVNIPCWHLRKVGMGPI
jgi:hypothetical protein